MLGLRYDVLLVSGGLFDLYDVENRREVLEVSKLWNPQHSANSARRQMAKTVGDLLIKLGVDGLDGVTALKSALRTLGQASNASDKQLEGLRKEIVQVAKASNVSQQAIRGQIDAFNSSQASIGSTVYKRLGKDIDTLTQSLDRLSRKEDEVAKKPATTKQLAAQFTSAVPEKTTRQLQAQQEMLQKAAVSSVEYTQRLVRLNAVTQEFTRSQQRQAVCRWQHCCDE